MIVSRTPLRISFAGGGTDLPEFCDSEWGAVTGMAIDRYVYVAVGRRFGGGVRLSGSPAESVERAAELRHPIARAALGHLGIEAGVEIASVADVPAGAGLGSSGIFAVGLLGALHAHLGDAVEARDLAAEACHMENDLPGEPFGRQDPYLAALGGLLHLQFHPGGRVRAEDILCAPGVAERLEGGLMLLYAGITGRTAAILSGEAPETRGGRNREPLRRLREIAVALRGTLGRGADLAELGAMLDESWRCKRRLSPAVSTPQIDALYERGLAAGALGGKLLGAGGGFLLLCCPPERREDVRRAVGLPEMRFSMDERGSQLHDLR